MTLLLAVVRWLIGLVGMAATAAVILTLSGGLLMVLVEGATGLRPGFLACAGTVLAAILFTPRRRHLAARP